MRQIAQLPPNLSAAFARHRLSRIFQPEELVVLEGEPCKAVYLVVEGLLRVRHATVDGREYVLAHLVPGQCAALAAAVDGGVHPASLQAVLPTTLCALPTTELHDLMSHDTAISLSVARLLADEVRQLDGAAQELALHPVRMRLARLLLEQAEGVDGRQVWTQQSLAESIGTVRDVVGRTLRAFAEEGLVRRERGRLVVVDRQGLEREAFGQDDERPFA